MANELTVTAKLSFSKGGAKVNRAFTIDVNITGDAFTHEVQSVGTTEEELPQGADLGTPGFILVKNLDSTNYVEVGHSTGVYAAKLLAGEVCLFRLNSGTLYAKANTAACLVEYIIVEA